MTLKPTTLNLSSPNSWRESISPFHSESRFSHLRGIRWRNARKLSPHVIDNVEIAVRPIVISQAHIGTHRLRVRSIELNQACKRQKTRERIIALHTRQYHRKIPVRQWQ